MFIILLATYNGENYIKQQIASILAQSYGDWRLVISDDGSTDKTVEIIEGYISDNPDKITLIKNQSDVHGAFGNFMNLINQAPKGDYYAFCDQDDQWYKDKLKVMSENLRGSGDKPMLVYHDLKVVDKEQNVLGEGFREYTRLDLEDADSFYTLMRYNITPGCSVCFNHSLKELIIAPKNPVSIHDWWTMLVAAGLGDIKRVDKVLGIYRQHDNNTLGIAKKSSGMGLVARYLKAGRLRWVLEKVKNAKEESYTMLKEFADIYSDSLDEAYKDHLKQYMHHLKGGNKLAALCFGLKKQNRQKGLIKNIYFWTVRLD